MIDIGANLSSSQFNKDLGLVINNAIEANISSLILTTTDKNNFYKNLKIIDEYNHLLPIYTTYGLHPHHANSYETIFSDIKEHLKNPFVKAIGEFGLDYFRMLSPQHIQLHVMDEFLTHAIDNPDLPLFLHEREAFIDFYNLLKDKQCQNKSVVHCFTGNTENIKAYLDLGCYIGITGWISDSKRNSELKEALQYVPLDRLMIETDCPYLTPRNIPKNILKGSFRNEPAYLPYVAKSIADLLNMDIDKIIEQTTQNSLDFFSISSYNKNNKIK